MTCVKGRVRGGKRQHQYPCMSVSSSIYTDHTCCGRSQFKAVLKGAHDPWWGSSGPESSPSPPFPSFCPVLPQEPHLVWTTAQAVAMETAAGIQRKRELRENNRRSPCEWNFPESGVQALSGAPRGYLTNACWKKKYVFLWCFLS